MLLKGELENNPKNGLSNLYFKQELFIANLSPVFHANR
jgi:hypothetical protein